VVELHAAPASLWRRALAFLIDAALIGGILAAYLAIASAVVGPARTHLTGLDYWMARARELEAALIPGVLLAIVLALTYSAVAGFLWNGRTLGRRLLGIQLVDKSGLAPAPARAIVRAILAAFSFAIFLAGFWLALFDRRGQTLHDKLTSTFVVRPVQFAWAARRRRVHCPAAHARPPRTGARLPRPAHP
jgi:uncharacterized RDD family membrane protein YckC